MQRNVVESLKVIRVRGGGGGGAATGVTDETRAVSVVVMRSYVVLISLRNYLQSSSVNYSYVPHDRFW